MGTIMKVKYMSFFFVPKIRTILLLLSIFCLSCSSEFLRKKDVKAFNVDVKGKIYITKKVIYINFNNTPSSLNTAIYPKGARIRILVEHSEDWIKVRAFPADENKEQIHGKVILYIIRDLQKEKMKKNYSIEELKKELYKIVKETL